MRILFLTLALPDRSLASGANSLRMAPILRQAESLRAAGASVEIFEVRGIPKLKYLHAMLRLRRAASTCDLIHAHYGFCGWVARSQFKLPVVVSFLGSDLLGGKNHRGRIPLRCRIEVGTNRLLARLAEGVIVQSAEMAKVLAPMPCHIVSTGIDLESFTTMDQSEARMKLGWRATTHYVLFGGNPEVPVKNFGLACETVRQLSTRLSDVELVPLWGVAPDHVPLYMNACDALLMTSLSEGSPNAVKEALACNLPVVSVPVGDVPELLRNVENSAVCSPEACTLSRALESVLLRRERSNGRSVLQFKGLGLSAVAKQLVRIYEKILGREKCALPQRSLSLASQKDDSGVILNASDMHSGDNSVIDVNSGRVG